MPHREHHDWKSGVNRYAQDHSFYYFLWDIYTNVQNVHFKRRIDDFNKCQTLTVLL